MIETKLNGTTLDIAEENIAKLKEIFPDVFCEGKIDFEKLQQVLGNYVEDAKERYNFSWNGKGKSLKLAQSPSTGTLLPCKEESKDWDTTENLYIEGDNLEVLKILQKSYHNKIKMIYIDPPYNTGKDFVYKDDFKDNIQNYLDITGQNDEEGNKITTNSESNGRYHTDWLNMMYPRLKLARNLLADDGVIFISIDENEVSNMQKICNEVFGEQNYAATFIWTKTSTPPSLSYKCRKTVEYVLAYEKSLGPIKYFGDYLDGGDVPFLNTGNPVKRITFPAKSISFKYMNSGVIPAGQKEKVFIHNEIEVDNGLNLNEVDISGEFKWEQETVYEEITNGTYFVVKSDKFSIRFQRTDLIETYKTPTNLLNIELNKDLGVGTNESAVKELKGLNMDKYFDYPKPISLITQIVKMICQNATEALILDFFSGSATTAHAVMQLNAEDGGNRKFICVQLPESCDESSEAFKAGYKNICEIGKERIRRAGDKIKSEIESENIQITLGEDEKKVPDIGFKVFKLNTSNIKKWQPDFDEIEDYISLMDNNFADGRTELDVIYEIMIKYGLDLTYPVEELSCGDTPLYSIGMGMLIICLANNIGTDVAKFISDYKKENEIDGMRVVFADGCFGGNDSLKTNIKEILKVAGVEEFITI